MSKTRFLGSHSIQVIRNSFRLGFALLFSAVCFQAQASDTKTKHKTIVIIGNSELPRVDAPLPWRVAGNTDPTKITIDKRKMPDALTPISVEAHRERIRFDKHIKVQTESLTKF